MCTTCENNEHIVNPIQIIPFPGLDCDDLSQACLKKVDAYCTYYKLGVNDITKKLKNLNVNTNTNLDIILNKIDDKFELLEKPEITDDYSENTGISINSNIYQLLNSFQEEIVNLIQTAGGGSISNGAIKINNTDTEKDFIDSKLLVDSTIDKIITTNLNGGKTITLKVKQSILDRISALEYIPQQINSFTNNINNIEKGSVITEINFNFGFNKTPITASVNNGVGNVTGNSKSITGLNITDNISYILTASDGNTTVNATTSINFLNKIYWGTSANTNLSSSQILSLTDNLLSSSKNRTIILNGNGQYIYYCYPSSLGDAIFNINGLTTTLEKSVVVVTNLLGNTTSYNVYRTSFVQNGTSISITVL